MNSWTGFLKHHKVIEKNPFSCRLQEKWQLCPAEKRSIVLWCKSCGLAREEESGICWRWGGGEKLDLNTHYTPPQWKSKLLIRSLQLGAWRPRCTPEGYRLVSMVTAVRRVESVLWRTQKPTSPLNLHPLLANVINWNILMTLILMKVFPAFSTVLVFPCTRTCGRLMPWKEG